MHTYIYKATFKYIYNLFKQHIYIQCIIYTLKQILTAKYLYTKRKCKFWLSEYYKDSGNLLK